MGPTDPVGSGSRNGRHQLPQLSHNEAEAAIAKLFESAGFTVLSEPRISGVSSLPLNPDILAFKNDEVLIIEVKVGREKDIVAEDAQGIEMVRQLFATQVASSRWRAFLNTGSPTRVESALVMIGAKPSGSLRSFAAETNVKLLSIDPETVRRAMKTSDEQQLKSIFDQALSGLPLRER